MQSFILKFHLYDTQRIWRVFSEFPKNGRKLYFKYSMDFNFQAYSLINFWVWAQKSSNLSSGALMFMRKLKEWQSMKKPSLISFLFRDSVARKSESKIGLNRVLYKVKAYWRKRALLKMNAKKERAPKKSVRPKSMRSEKRAL